MSELLELTALQLRALWRAGCGWCCLAMSVMVLLAFAQQPAALRNQGVWLDASAWIAMGTLSATLVPVLWCYATPDRTLRCARPAVDRTSQILAILAATSVIVATGAATLWILRAATFSAQRTTAASESWPWVVLSTLGLALTTAAVAAAIPPRGRRRWSLLPVLAAGLHGWAVGLPSEIIGSAPVGLRPLWALAFACGASILATAVSPPRSIPRAPATWT